MKFFFTISAFCFLFFALIFSGCTSQSPLVQQQTPTPATTVAILSPTLTAVPFPGALGMDQFSCFGSGNGQASAIVYRYEIRPYYNWTSSSWNSPREQAAASKPLELQNGYNMEKPKEGNTFLFIFIRVENIGNQTVRAPSANQFVVYSDGKIYNYSSVHSSDVVIDQVSGKQYDYLFGQDRSVGYIQPGESNQAEGYLIYEIPVSFSPEKTYVMSNLDYQNTAIWKLG